MVICVVTTRHRPMDDRIYFKEILSLKDRYPTIILIAPVDDADQLPGDIGFIPLKRRHGLGRLVSVLEAVRIITKIAPDICHFHDYDLLAAVPLLRMFRRSKLIYDVHEIYHQYAAQLSALPKWVRTVLAQFICFFEEFLAKRCDQLFTAVEPLTLRFVRHNIRATTIFNYPRLEIIESLEPRSINIARRYAENRVIIYQGTMSRDRGLFHTIQATARIKDSIPSIKLILLGAMDASLRKEAEQQIEAFDVRKHVDIISMVPHQEVFDYIRIAKIGLIPFLPVGQFLQAIPVKLFEYMACGAPVLGADLPPVAYYLKESGCGRTYDSRSVDALAQGVVDMLADEQTLRHMGAGGARAVREHWSWRRMEEVLLEAYGRLEKDVQSRTQRSS